MSPCRWIKLPDGGVANVRYSDPPRRRCVFCPQWSVALCDGRNVEHRSGTCDKPMCGQHRKPVGPDRDLCPDCVKNGVLA